MYQADIEVCPICHFRLPQVMGYYGTIRCHCGKIVFDNTIVICNISVTTNSIDDYMTNLSHSSSLLSL